MPQRPRTRHGGGTEARPLDRGRRLVRAGLACAIVDFLWAVVLTRIYGGTFARLWQGVAATVFGPAMFEGGTWAVTLGLAMHVLVAFSWSALFLGLFLASSRLRLALASPTGMFAVAAVYGPLVWVAMSAGVIPSFSGQPPAMGIRWWIQLAGHALFVGLPIVWGVRGGFEKQSRTGVRP